MSRKSDSSGVCTKASVVGQSAVKEGSSQHSWDFQLRWSASEYCGMKESQTRWFVSRLLLMMMMMMMSRIERTDIRVLFTFLFAVGSDVSILKAPLAAAISPFMSPLNPPNP